MRLKSTLACVAAAVACAVAAPAAGAQVLPGAGLGASAIGPCGSITSGPDSGLAGLNYQQCFGSGLVFNGPSIGRIATVIGPTIISPGFAGVVGVSAGTVVIGPGAGSQVAP